MGSRRRHRRGWRLSSDKPGSQGRNAVSGKLSGDKLWLIAGVNEIATLGHAGDELRRHGS
jgi:hypothetical protein